MEMVQMGSDPQTAYPGQGVNLQSTKWLLQGFEHPHPQSLLGSEFGNSIPFHMGLMSPANLHAIVSFRNSIPTAYPIISRTFCILWNQPYQQSNVLILWMTSCDRNHLVDLLLLAYPRTFTVCLTGLLSGLIEMMTSESKNHRWTTKMDGSWAILWQPVSCMIAQEIKYHYESQCHTAYPGTRGEIEP